MFIPPAIPRSWLFLLNTSAGGLEDTLVLPPTSIDEAFLGL